MIRLIDPNYLGTLRLCDNEPCTVVDKAVTFGIEAIDSRIGGGLMKNALHELFAASTEDASAAAAFAIMLAMRAGLASRLVIWVREWPCEMHTGHLCAAGLVELGLNPDALVLVDAPDTRSMLRAGADLAKCGQVGMVIIEPWRNATLFDLTASRRLSMATAASGVTMLALRVGATPTPSAAQTRWRVAAAPSSQLAASAPGQPAFDIALLRHRGGIAGFETRMEWNRDTRSFALLSGGASAVAAFGADQTRQAA